MKIIVIRHGETEWNASSKIQGQRDIELNDNGRKQALMTGEIIKDKKIDLIISSPLKRARETAEIINILLNVPIIEDDRLMERYWGVNEGKTKAEIQELKKTNPLIEDSWDYSKNVKYDDIEPMHEFCDRITEFLDEATSKYEGQNLLLVTHGGVSIPLHYILSKSSLEEIHNRKEVKGLRNGEYEEYDV